MRKHIRLHARRTRYIIYKETMIDLKEHLITFIGAFLGIGAIGFMSSQHFTAYDNLFLIGSFGASSVLVYGIPNSPLAQPRNVIGGHVVCAIIGVIIHKLIPGEVWLSSALSVSLSIVLMQITKTLHPPGGATALIANIGSAKIQALGFFYVISPVFLGVLFLTLVAIVCNNVGGHRSYPRNKHWYKVWKRRYAYLNSAGK
ncbi:HPP family protein [Mucilaginibacter daejeonensis]|uniref:HPP family protein n=1 Tax=Mucilaginibacter daejeonensis TaxID=398049 RepID=UPI001D17514C|nr:HPP family protein [Mucilaginibacter daejeonensis]UEG53791.1 HPP family protein [Mucilaginibacter daejeonensis]